MRVKLAAVLSRSAVLLCAVTGFLLGLRWKSEQDEPRISGERHTPLTSACYEAGQEALAELDRRRAYNEQPWRAVQDVRASDMSCEKLFLEFPAKASSPSEQQALLYHLCAVQWELAPYGASDKHAAKALLIDTSRSPGQSPPKTLEYYSKRDAATWTLALNRIGFDVDLMHFPSKTAATKAHHSATSVGRWTALFCLGLLHQDDVCLAPKTHARMRRRQRVNQLNGLRHILWTKDSFCRTVKMATQDFEGDTSFVLPCFVLPEETNLLKAADASWTGRQKWIVKPSGRGEGRGIFVADHVEEVLSRPFHDAIVQPFVDNPLLIDGYKFDMRTYVLVTSISPLRVYFYHEGLVRFAATKYHEDEGDDTKSNSKAKRKDQFLTNTSIGKKFRNLSDLTWPLAKLRHWLATQHGSCREVFDGIHAAIVKTLMSAEPAFHRHFLHNMGHDTCDNCFQLLGVDVMLTTDYQPIVLEINGLPSMQLSSEADFLSHSDAVIDTSDRYAQTKLNLTRDITAMLFRPTPVADLVDSFLRQSRIGVGPGLGCQPRQHLTCITKHDLPHLIRFAQEYQNRGAFQLLYPAPATPPADEDKYAAFVEHVHRLTATEHGGRQDSSAAEYWQESATTTFRLHQVMQQLAVALRAGNA